MPCLAMLTYIAPCRVLLMIALEMMPHYVMDPIVARKPDCFHGNGISSARCYPLPASKLHRCQIVRFQIIPVKCVSVFMTGISIYYACVCINMIRTRYHTYMFFLKQCIAFDFKIIEALLNVVPCTLGIHAVRRKIWHQREYTYYIQ